MDRVAGDARNLKPISEEFGWPCSEVVGAWGHYDPAVYAIIGLYTFGPYRYAAGRH